ncbi:MAG: Fic family protein [Roseburia sp.]|nr:Fic family protein [Roseburia sp.]
MENNEIEVQLTDVFSLRLTDDVSAKMDLYECLENQQGHICNDIFSGNIKIKHKNAAFRQNQIWENAKFKKVSFSEYNPPTPEKVPELMKELEIYWNEEIKAEPVIKAGLFTYQFLTIMPYEENNEIWLSILLNSFFRRQGMGSDYYIPFARYFAEQNMERETAMRHTRESGDYVIWIHFFINVMEMAVAKTNQAIMQLEQIHKNTLASIEKEKQQLLLQEVSAFMEENPVFVIHDIEREFRTAYNTAAKSVAILEKHGVIKEISNKQRYRVYCYEKLIREILK